MGTSTWGVVKTDWGSELYTSAAQNRVEGNIDVLGKGGGRAAIASATAAGSTTLPNNDDKVFTLATSGTETVDYISTTNRALSNEITLIVSGSGCTLNHNTGSVPANFASLQIFRMSTGSQATTIVYSGQRIVFTLTASGWTTSVH